MIKDVFAVLFNRILSRAGNLLVLALLARYLSKEDMGVYGLTTMVSYSVIYLASLGLRNSSAFFIAKGLFQESQVKQTLLYIWPLIATLAFGLMLGVSAYNLSGKSTTDVIILSALAVVPMMFVYVTQGLFLASKNIRAFNKSEILSRYFLLASVILLIIADQVTLSTALITFALSHFTSVIYIAAVAYRERSSRHISIDAFRRVLPMIKQGGALSLTLAFITMNTSFSVYFTSVQLGAGVATLVFAALKITDLVTEAASSASLVSYSHTVSQNNRNRALYQNLQAAWALFAVAAVGVMILLPLSEWVIRIAYGEKYLDAVATLNWIALSLPFLCYARVANSGLNAQGAITSGTLIQASEVIINAVICFTFGTSVEHIAIALLVSRLVSFLAYSIIIAHTMKVSVIRTALPRRRQLRLGLRRLHSAYSAALSRAGLPANRQRQA
ncbi:Hypothetical protein HDN1F_23460 [gamma proteobacterium HdN1]|nr:Hypothetical protein HDN1F_23460 [gamma proteobacterium HdN1]